MNGKKYNDDNCNIGNDSSILLMIITIVIIIMITIQMMALIRSIIIMLMAMIDIILLIITSMAVLVYGHSSFAKSPVPLLLLVNPMSIARAFLLAGHKYTRF